MLPHTACIGITARCSQRMSIVLWMWISFSLSLSPPPHLCLSSSQPTQEQGTAGRRTMCECEGHLTKRGAIFGCDQQPPSFKHVWLMPYSKQWFASHSVVTPVTREKEAFVYPSQLKGWYKIKTHTFSVDFRALWHRMCKNILTVTIEEHFENLNL